MKLYEIPAQFSELWEQIQNAETDDQISDLEAQFRVMLQESTDKVEAAAKVVKMLEAEAEAAENESRRLLDRATRTDQNAKRLKGLMLFAVDQAFSGKVKTPLFSIWGQTSGETVKFEPAPDADLMQLPKQYVRISADLDRKALGCAYKAGEQLPDAVLVSVQPGTRFLRIK